MPQDELARTGNEPGVPEADSRQAAAFQTTAWADVLAAGGESPAAAAALERLCRLYWPPLYCYLRRQGQLPEADYKMIAELGFAHAEVAYVQPLRKRGITKNNFYTLYDMAMLGITSHSKIPLRLATMAGFALSALSLVVACVYLVIKLTHWNEMSFGTAPVLIGFFFFASVQLFFIGILGEYVAAMHTQILHRPLVVERERVNFDRAPDV